MPSGENAGEQGGGGSPSSSNVDVVGAVGDGPTPSGDPVSKSEGGVNPRDSPSRHATPPGDKATHQDGTEFELHANSGTQSFLSSESSEQDSDTRHRCRVKANLAKRLAGKKKDGPSTGAGETAVTEPSVNASNTALSTTQGQELSNLQALLSLAQQLQAGSLSVAPSSSGTSRA